MADLILANFVKETSTTTGTGTYSLAGAATGHQGFVAGVGGGSKVPYFVTDGTNWEHGLGTVTDAATDTISRDKIYASSNAGAAVSWAAGTRDIYAALGCSPRRSTHTITGNTTLSYAHRTVLCNSASDFTVTLPPAADFQGQEYTIQNINTGKVTIDGNASEEIRDPRFGALTTLDLWVIYDSVTIISDGSAWYVSQRNFTPHIITLRRDAALTVTGAGTAVRANFDAAEISIGATYDFASNWEVLINRGGVYDICGTWAQAPGDTFFISCDFVDASDNQICFARTPSSAASQGIYVSAIGKRILTAGTRYGYRMYQNSGGDLSTITTVIGRPTLSLVEVL